MTDPLLDETTDTTHAPDSGFEPDTAATATDDAEIELDVIERDLDGVQAALGRLDDGTYWTDEVTGEPIPDEVLAEDPTARRAG